MEMIFRCPPLHEKRTRRIAFGITGLTFGVLLAGYELPNTLITDYCLRITRPRLLLLTGYRLPLTVHRSLFHFQHGKECRLGDFHIADLPHPFLAFLLFFKKFSFSCNVAPVTFRSDILADRFNGFPGNDF